MKKTVGLSAKCRTKITRQSSVSKRWCPYQNNTWVPTKKRARQWRPHWTFLEIKFVEKGKRVPDRFKLANAWCFFLDHFGNEGFSKKTLRDLINSLLVVYLFSLASVFSPEIVHPFYSPRHFSDQKSNWDQAKQNRH